MYHGCHKRMPLFLNFLMNHVDSEIYADYPLCAGHENQYFERGQHTVTVDFADK